MKWGRNNGIFKDSTAASGSDCSGSSRRPRSRPQTPLWPDKARPGPLHTREGVCHCRRPLSQASVAPEGPSASSGRCFFHRSPRAEAGEAGTVRLRLVLCLPPIFGGLGTSQSIPLEPTVAAAPSAGHLLPETSRSAPARAGGVPGHLPGHT